MNMYVLVPGYGGQYSHIVPAVQTLKVVDGC